MVMNYLESHKNMLANSLSRCHSLPSKDELANTTYLIPLSDTASIEKFKGVSTSLI